MNILIIGQKGMLGRCLEQKLSITKNTIYTESKLDITDYQGLKEYICSIHHLDCIINCAAVTDTNLCNTNDGMIRSFSVNCDGIKKLAKICNDFGIHLVHISTDYVHSEFSSTMNDEFPVNIYGCHKLLGEKFIQETFDDIHNYSILRCSWLYGITDKKKNFVEKILEFCEKSKDGTIKVVDDCYGRPTSVEYVTKFIEQCLVNGQYGIIDSQIYNNPISRYDFAKMIVNNSNKDIEVIPVKSDYFKNAINQPKTVPSTFTDQSHKLEVILGNIPHNDDYEYWLQRYFEQKGK